MLIGEAEFGLLNCSLVGSLGILPDLWNAGSEDSPDRRV